MKGLLKADPVLRIQSSDMAWAPGGASWIMRWRLTEETLSQVQSSADYQVEQTPCLRPTTSTKGSIDPLAKRYLNQSVC